MANHDPHTNGAAPEGLGTVSLTTEEARQRRKRNLAIAFGLGAFIILVFAVTVLRLGGAVAERTF